MEAIKHYWQKSIQAASTPQSVDYARVAKRSTVVVAGFTIIEVLIVLAIAGLILLIVFLAVPALQRNSRNTGRKEDAGRLDSAVHDFVSSNSTGALPTQAAWAANCATVETDAGNLNQYTGLTCQTGSVPASITSASGSGFYETNSGAVTPPATVSANAVILSEQAVCNGTSSTTTTGSSPTTAALLYSIESGGAQWNWACINIQ